MHDGKQRHRPGASRLRALLPHAARLGLGAATLATIISPPATHARRAGAPPAAPPVVLQGRGGWQPHGAGRAQHWQLDVQRGPGSAVRGRLAIRGSGLFSAANVEGSVDGTRVSGTLVDDTGRLLATFSGSVQPNGAAAGTYLDVSGETGEWATEGTPLRAVAAQDPPPAAPPPADVPAASPAAVRARDAAAAAVRGRLAALSAIPHPPDPRREADAPIPLPTDSDAPPRVDSGATEPDRLEPPALPPRHTRRTER